MITLISKPQMIEYIEKFLLSYETASNDKNVKREFIKGSFHLKIYHTGTITITGKDSKKVASKLVKYTNEENSLGFDEVGVGDFFGPTVYCGVCVEKDQLEWALENDIKIMDSKKLGDTYILEKVKILKDKFMHKYNVVYDKDLEKNLNSIEQKSFYHNQLYDQLPKDSRFIVIDLYTTVNNFNKVNDKLKLNWHENTILETKADSKYYSVALASMFARYYFLQEMAMLRKKYNYNLPLGANVKDIAKDVKEKIGKKEMASFCKTTFKTFDEI